MRMGTMMILVASLALSPLTGWSHTGRTIFPVYELPSSDLPDLHDESLEDWEEVLPNASLTHDDLEMSNLESSDTGDLAFRVFLAWHFRNQTMYFALERLDDDYVPVESDTYGGERIDFLIDGDHSGGEFLYFSTPDHQVSAEERERYSNSQAQWYFVKPEPHPVTGQFSHLFGGKAGWAAMLPWMDIGGVVYGESPSIAVVEMSVTPWDDLFWEGPEVSERTELRPGSVVGLQIRVYDVDGDAPNSFDLFTLGRSDNPGDLTADAFVDAELIPCFVSDCSGGTDTVIRQNSWARIKASFR